MNILKDNHEYSFRIFRNGMNIHDIQSVRLSDRGSERGGEGERGGDVEGHARRRGQCLGAVM